VYIKPAITLTLLSSLIMLSTYPVSSIAESKQAASPQLSVFKGNVIETFDTGGYTYVKINTKNGPIWAAGPITAINKNDEVAFTGKSEMKDFYSMSLKRKFESIYFVDAYLINGKNANAVKSNPHQGMVMKPAVTLKTFDKAEDGYTIAELLEDKSALAGKKIKVRGQIVKYTAQVMNKNWVHLQDNSSDVDITITTNDSANMNDVVLAEGVLSVDKNVGYGYSYEIFIEDAKMTVEP